MMTDFTYESATKAAEHLKAIGMTDISLWRDPNPPWHLATSCEPGGSHRLDISTDASFYAEDPKTGLTFRWSFDIEPMSANGTGSYQINAAGCKTVLSKLRGEARAQFRAYLSACAAKVRDKGLEYQRIADRQAADAATLRDLVGEP